MDALSTVSVFMLFPLVCAECLLHDCVAWVKAAFDYIVVFFNMAMILPCKLAATFRVNVDYAMVWNLIHDSVNKEVGFCA